MNPYLIKIPLAIDESFSLRTDISRGFNSQWHYHSEIELIYIIQGTGTGFFGNSIRNIEDDDLILIGSNLPHMLKSDPEVYHSHSERITEALVLHFPPNILTTFLQLPENKKISNLLQQTNLGILLTGNTKVEIIKTLKLLNFAKNSQRLIYLLQILQLIIDEQNHTLLSEAVLKPFFNKNDENRLNRVYHYTLNNFSREIKLKEIADIVYMSPHSFCRYFKSRTKKRYSLFLLEVRISHACKLLSSTDYSIAIISYESGFMNLSNFNRHFKLIVGKTPLEYRKQFHIKH
ncbi:AraC family transcriptional regulator [Pedobacter cryophilus]|uniref:AraC family transcriptional regulator n=1 Tax=Pedobacter cryophilus TaxID=2571271 RepID=A0A4V5P0H4_9SPHI|nr:AraC family transcriptional regulator [Pedobacter cryophilus]TKB97797.1 AraC family transcriptional regulator [Pedobacter cryophilus]